MGKLSRTKGAAFEREVVKQLKPLFPHARRSLVQSRSGSEAPDVIGVPGWWIETKHHKRVPIQAAMRQAVEANDGGSDHVAVITKDNHADPVVTLRLEDFLWLLEVTQRMGTSL